MGVNNSLLKSIQTIVDKAIEIAPFDKTRQAQIITNNGDGAYAIRLDGILYNNVPSYPKTNVLEVGSIAKIVMPSNQSSQMYIQSSKGGGGGDHKELTRAEYEALTPEQKNDGTVYFVTDGDPDYFIMSDSVPIGAIQAFGGETAPEGWLICDGSAVSRETYPDLFKVIGTAYGSGDGSTTFNLPDQRGRVLIGTGGGYSLGATGGEKTHTLTVNEMPAQNKGSSGYGYALNWGTPEGDGRLYGASIGGGQAHNNMQPYIVTNYIIKALQPPTDNVIKNLDPQSLVLDAFYPVGSCYETTNIQFNPNIVWGGIWEKEEFFDDYIVDEGVSGIWTWRKWASGLAECWGNKSYSFSGFNQWGQVYSYDIGATAYPSNFFIAKPFFNISQAQYSGGNSWSSMESGGSQNETPGTIIMRGTSQTGSLTGTVYYVAKGYWKTPEPMDKTYKWHRTA